MKRNGPLLTLLAGLAVAAVLIMLSVTAATKDDNARNAANNAAPENVGRAPGASIPAAPGAGPTGAAPTGAATQAVGAPLASPVTWAGKVSGNAATLAIAGRNGKVIAYLCDGKKLEAWLQGTAVGGVLTLSGRSSSATGTFGNGVASGTITVNGRKWTFRLPTVQAPSGLYRAMANVRNAKYVAGWIVVNGQQVGAFTVDGGEPDSAPALDTYNNSATFEGETVPAAAVDGDTAL